ncbi:MAG TPA: hypothetical protein DCY12_04225 [Candidatus Atribacteria bacterium]|nr:hypothetical protein [Candidatus Atribacteria bacterium]
MIKEPAKVLEEQKTWCAIGKKVRGNILYMGQGEIGGFLGPQSMRKTRLTRLFFKRSRKGVFGFYGIRGKKK